MIDALEYSWLKFLSCWYFPIDVMLNFQDFEGYFVQVHSVGGS